MNEHTHVPKLLAELRKTPPAVVLKHSDKIIYGIPDISYTLNRLTTWIEVKWADPDFESQGIQELTCLRLAATSRCIYVIYEKKPQRTYIVEPHHVKNFRDNYIQMFEGHDYVNVRIYVENYHL